MTKLSDIISSYTVVEIPNAGRMLMIFGDYFESELPLFRTQLSEE